MFDNSQALLWEESQAPRQLRFEQTLGNQLTVKVVAYGYAAFTAGDILVRSARLVDWTPPPTGSSPHRFSN